MGGPGAPPRPASAGAPSPVTSWEELELIVRGSQVRGGLLTLPLVIQLYCLEIVLSLELSLPSLTRCLPLTNSLWRCGVSAVLITRWPFSAQSW